MKKNIVLLTGLVSICMNISAAGVSLGATRLVFPADKQQISVKTYNTDTKGNYLIQSWVADENGNKVDDFVVTPPLFVQKANSDSVLRVVYVGNQNSLPKDREKLYFFNSKVIPSLSKEEQEISNALLIATTTNIKLFMRPSQFIDGSLEAYKKISCSFNNGEVLIKNDSPYYMTLTDLKINDAEFSTGIMVPPFDSKSVSTKYNSKLMKYKFINDYGVRSEELICTSN